MICETGYVIKWNDKIGDILFSYTSNNTKQIEKQLLQFIKENNLENDKNIATMIEDTSDKYC